MTGTLPSRPRPAHVPVLTEVIDLPGLQPPAPPEPAALPTEAQLTQRVVQEVQRQVDGMLEFRLREAIGPVLARHTDAMVQDLRQELSRTLRDVVARAVAQELARQRQR